MKFIEKSGKEKNKMSEPQILDNKSEKLYTLLMTERIFMTLLAKEDNKKNPATLMKESFDTASAFTKFVRKKEEELKKEE